MFKDRKYGVTLISDTRMQISLARRVALEQGGVREVVIQLPAFIPVAFCSENWRAKHVADALEMAAEEI